MEYTIGSTELRQRLTDVLLAVRERHAAYLIETFDRPQAALVNLDDYQDFQRYRAERESFFNWLEDVADRNAERNRNLSDEEVQQIIAQARKEANAPQGD